MHHMYPTSKGDPLCPLGFHPQVRWPTRCKRCFRDYKDHIGKKGNLKDTTASSPSLSPWEPSSGRSTEKTDKRTWASTSNLSKDGTKLYRSTEKTDKRTWASTSNLSKDGTKLYRSTEKTDKRTWASTSNLSKDGTKLYRSTEKTDKRTWASTSNLSKDGTKLYRSTEKTDKRTWASTSNLSKDGTKLFPQSEPQASWTSVSDLSTIGKDGDAEVDAGSTTVPKQKSYTGSQSDSFTFRRFSYTLGDEPKIPQKLQIKGVIDNSNEGASNNDVEFIIQVKKSRAAEPVKLPENMEKEQFNDMSDKGGKTEKNEIEKLKAQLSEMRARCEKVEKEKSDILLRRLATMDTVSNKSSSNEVTKLQKTVKELQGKNEVLSEEKLNLSARVKTLEKEVNSKLHRNEREKINEELRSKLKAAETLCENLMDENEDMKKEIRELEEEIYEMQDNFREEQADEYTNLRKDLEQSNKNCRILSFKLRKLERKAEQLENEKLDMEKKYEEVKKVEDVLRKVGGEYKNRSQKKTTELTTKVQLRKMVDEMEKEIGDVVGIFASIIEGKDVEVPNAVPQETNAKFDKLSKEHELLKQKLDKTMRDLATEKEGKKTEKTKATDDNKNTELQSLKKKLEEAINANREERATWESERVKLHEEKEKLKSKLLSLSAEKLKVYNEVVQLKKDLESAASSGKENAKMLTAMNALKEELTTESEKCRNLQNDLTSYMEREGRIAKTLASVELTKAQIESELKRVKQEVEDEKSSVASKLASVGAELAEVKKEKEKMKAEFEKNIQNKESEISTLKKKMSMLEKAGMSAKKMNEMKQTYNEKILNLENELKKVAKQNEETNVKNGDLTDSKAHLESQNKILSSKLLDQRHDLSNLEAELKALRETQNTKQGEWISEKLRLEERVRELDRALSKSSRDEKTDDINRLKKENVDLKEQLEDFRRMNDDLTSKLKDYNTVSKIQRNWSADTSALEVELRKAKSALANADKLKKADLAQCKMRYEHRITAINDEIQSIQNQLSRYKRERDTYKHMLEGAQKTIGNPKSVRQRRQSTASTGKSDEDEETLATNISVLEKQISCMEDELSESRLEASKLKTELVSEKSAWQVKLSEMQSHINELEEERILASGRTKIPGLKVRMELAWQKEREEQQRLLQETSTLARDLRQTLFEIERERDKERLENKRKQDQLKKIFDEEKDENKKKLIELQCDLLELRDAHAKLRTSNEKMRREKERHEREREELRDIISSKRRLEQNEARNVNMILQQVDDLMKLFPELGVKRDEKQPETYTPTPPRRLKGPKSRESSPMLESKDDVKGSTGNLGGRTEKLEYTIGKLMEVAKELKETKKAFDDGSAMRTKKFGKRSTSIDNDQGRGTTPSRTGADKSHKSSLKRKSLSLEQTSGKHDQIIWGTDSNVSSMQSLDGSEADTRHFNMQRDSSVDSRLSGGSTKSEMLQRDKKYNKGIIRKITTKLTKSASVDDPNSSFDYSMQTSGSEASINEETKHEKRNLKKKLSDMFKRGSRSNSLDRKAGSQDTSRPSSRNSMASKT